MSNKYYSSKNIRKINAVYNIIYGKRSKGKTYDMIFNFLTEYWEARKKGELSQSIYLRRRDVDIKGRVPTTVCDTLVCNGEGVNVVEQITGGEYDDIKFYQRGWYLSKTDKNGLVKKDKEPFMMALALSQYSSNKGGAYPYVKNIWFEEFIEVYERAYLVDEFKIFANVISTIVRSRTDVKIWMTGNTVDRFCPYFDEMGLDRISTQKQGTIDTYKLGKSGKKIAVERTKDSGAWKDSETNNDYYFAFSNPELKMITDGEWEIGAYPIQISDVNSIDVCGRFFVLFKDQTIQCDIISNDDEAYIYMHTDIDPLSPMDKKYDLIYSLEPSMRPNYRRNFRNAFTDAERVIKQLIDMNKILFDSNMTGNVYDNFIKRS